MAVSARPIGQSTCALGWLTQDDLRPYLKEGESYSFRCKHTIDVAFRDCRISSGIRIQRLPCSMRARPTPIPPVQFVHSLRRKIQESASARTAAVAAPLLAKK